MLKSIDTFKKGKIRLVTTYSTSLSFVLSMGLYDDLSKEPGILAIVLALPYNAFFFFKKKGLLNGSSINIHYLK